MDFPALGRDYARRDARLMLVPAWDFGRDGWLHSRMAVLRAVEGGFALARSARTGLLTVADDRGRVLGDVESASAPVATLTTAVPLGSGETVYARFGDWFAWLCLAGLGMLAVTAASARRASGDGRAEGDVRT